MTDRTEEALRMAEAPRTAMTPEQHVLNLAQALTIEEAVLTSPGSAVGPMLDRYEREVALLNDSAFKTQAESFGDRFRTSIEHAGPDGRVGSGAFDAIRSELTELRQTISQGDQHESGQDRSVSRKDQPAATSHIETPMSDLEVRVSSAIRETAAAGARYAQQSMLRADAGHQASGPLDAAQPGDWDGFVAMDHAREGDRGILAHRTQELGDLVDQLPADHPLRHQAQDVIDATRQIDPAAERYSSALAHVRTEAQDFRDAIVSGDREEIRHEERDGDEAGHELEAAAKSLEEVGRNLQAIADPVEEPSEDGARIDGSAQEAEGSGDADGFRLPPTFPARPEADLTEAVSAGVADQDRALGDQKGDGGPHAGELQKVPGGASQPSAPQADVEAEVSSLIQQTAIAAERYAAQWELTSEANLSQAQALREAEGATVGTPAEVHDEVRRVDAARSAYDVMHDLNDGDAAILSGLLDRLSAAAERLPADHPLRQQAEALQREADQIDDAGMALTEASRSLVHEQDRLRGDLARGDGREARSDLHRVDEQAAVVDQARNALEGMQARMHAIGHPEERPAEGNAPDEPRAGVGPGGLAREWEPGDFGGNPAAAPPPPLAREWDGPERSSSDNGAAFFKESSATSGVPDDPEGSDGIDQAQAVGGVGGSDGFRLPPTFPAQPGSDTDEGAGSGPGGSEQGSAFATSAEDDIADSYSGSEFAAGSDASGSDPVPSPEEEEVDLDQLNR